MKIIVLLLTLLCGLTTETNAKVPRQKIQLQGLVKSGTPKSLTISELEKIFPVESIVILDPYNNDLHTKFYGFSFIKLIEKYAGPKAKTVTLKAIDGYQALIPLHSIAKENLFLTYRDQNNYLSVDRMGPTRLIAPIKGKISKDALMKIGVNWVWQLNAIEFVE